MPPSRPTPQMVRDARITVLDLHSDPHRRVLAWAILKSARGQTVHQSRITQMQHHAAVIAMLTGGAA
ncbi:hypothetical protein LGQ03_07320 [Loktanella sp. TSTF-M6]|uniref:Uncharacterized protein n=1 Tax=Loktanella gaetbuli TaxID=2881335 RepID=A0ABS8BTL2_9RHOB|nr:hypothetical protein [Loktanella gaetbuli]MCB5199046.1 hypothetical protein [Loktanella gaetbuli]